MNHEGTQNLTTFFNFVASQLKVYTDHCIESFTINENCIHNTLQLTESKYHNTEPKIFNFLWLSVFWAIFAGPVIIFILTELLHKAANPPTFYLPKCFWVAISTTIIYYHNRYDTWCMQYCTWHIETKSLLKWPLVSLTTSFSKSRRNSRIGITHF